MTKLKSSYDCVIVGGGHNGLVTAAYLAKAGKSVCVLERRHLIGGCSVSEELWPGYQVSTAAYVISLFLPEIINDLKLKENGLKILPRSPSSFTPMKDGRHLLLGPDAQSNHQQISKFSSKDAESFPKYEKLLEKVAGLLEPTLSQTAPDILPVSKGLRKIGLMKKLRDMKKAWKMQSALKSLGDALPEAMELLTGAARPILDRWFETDVLKATLATDAVIGAFSSISAPGTAYVLLHHVMGEAGGARGVWGYVQGGMGGLSQSLARVCENLGVDILTEAEVEEIVVDGQQARGVRLADGTSIDAKAVASNADAHVTFEKLVAAEHLPEEFARAISRIDYSSASAKINVALSEPPEFTCLPSQGVGSHHRATIHIGETMEVVENGFDDAKYGNPSRTPILEITLPTSVDNTIAPDGKHIMSMFVQYAPYQLGGGKNWDDIKEGFADRCIEVLAEYAPNVPNAIEHRQVLSPLDLERVYGLTGGNIMQGAMNFNQLFLMRPIPGWADHRSPIGGLYLCGAASHPGGGVMGACGKNAAAEILRDF
ncbi:MAG: NAD(P)/FAD-dependent oxidoreductase [Pirellulaceae bacterium]|jgi:phytoene dehydrogenase-like protein|nr:NAD(P)/FAD-dependent oxidoreductase [Pirellulaceae bacterium]